MARHRALAAFRIAEGYAGAVTMRGPGRRSVRSDGPGPSRKVLLAHRPGIPCGPGWYGMGLSPDDDWTSDGWRIGERHVVLRHPGGLRSDDAPDLCVGADAERVGEFLGRIFLPRVSRVDRAHYARALARSGLEVLAWSRNGRIVGSVTLTRTMGTTAIHALSVHPEWRSRGWGRRILTWAIAAADGETLLTAGEPLVDWYESHGFVSVGELRYWTS